MASGTKKISEGVRGETVKPETPSLDIRPGRLNKCKLCGMKTYQKNGMCVLCKIGLTDAVRWNDSI